MLTFRHVLTWLGVCGWWNTPLLVEGIGSELVEGGDDGGITLSWLEEKSLDEEGLIKPSKIQTKGKACEDKSNINPTNPGFFKTWPCRAVEFSSNLNQIMVFRVTGRCVWSGLDLKLCKTVQRWIWRTRPNHTAPTFCQRAFLGAVGRLFGQQQVFDRATTRGPLSCWVCMWSLQLLHLQSHSPHVLYIQFHGMK